MGRKKVAIFGGGISGLTIAHECIEMGLDVALYEQHTHHGGKAVGYKLGSGRPVEHAVHVYTSTYVQLFETLKRIPYQDKTVFDNLVPASSIELSTCKTKEPVERTIPILFSVPNWQKFKAIFRVFKAYGLTRLEGIILFYHSVRYFFSSIARHEELKHISFEDYLKLNKKSQAYQDFITHWLGTIVACKRSAQAYTMIDLLARTLLGGNFFELGVKSSLSYFNGPSNERFINPWIDHLKKLGPNSSFETGKALKSLEIKDGKVEKAILEDGTEVKADCYALALSYRTLRRIAPGLNIPEKVHFEWAFGAQFFLKKIPERLLKRDCKAIFAIIDSPWYIAYEIQGPHLWKDVELPEGVEAVVSVTIGMVQDDGLLYKKPFYQHSKEEVQDEILHQMNFTEKECIIDFELGPDIVYLSEEEYQKDKEKYVDWEVTGINSHGARWAIESFLYVPTVDATERMLDVTTCYPNVFLAGEYVKCDLVTPNTNKANLSGKLAAKTIGDFLKVDPPFPEDRLYVPPFCPAWFRKIDKWVLRTSQFFRSKWGSSK